MKGIRCIFYNSATPLFDASVTYPVMLSPDAYFKKTVRIYRSLFVMALDRKLYKRVRDLQTIYNRLSCFTCSKSRIDYTRHIFSNVHDSFIVVFAAGFTPFCLSNWSGQQVAPCVCNEWRLWIGEWYNHPYQASLPGSTSSGSWDRASADRTYSGPALDPTFHKINWHLCFGCNQKSYLRYFLMSAFHYLL